jgi:hypothetical protein
MLVTVRDGRARWTSPNSAPDRRQFCVKVDRTWSAFT